MKAPTDFSLAGASLQLYHEEPKALIIVRHELKSLNTWKRVRDSRQHVDNLIIL